MSTLRNTRSLHLREAWVQCNHYNTNHEHSGQNVPQNTKVRTEPKPSEIAIELQAE